jgi:hypothetical protein
MTPENLPGLQITADQLGAIWTPITVPRHWTLGFWTQRQPAVKAPVKIAA